MCTAAILPRPLGILPILLISCQFVLGSARQSSTLSSLYYNGTFLTASHKPAANETLHTGESDPERPTVYFQPSTTTTTPSSTTNAAQSKPNLTVMDFHKHAVSASVEYDDENGSKSGESGVKDRTTSSEEDVRTIQIDPNQQWSPLIPTATDQNKQPMQQQLVKQRKTKKKPTKPLVLIAESVRDQDDDEVDEQSSTNSVNQGPVKYVLVSSSNNGENRMPFVVEQGSNEAQGVEYESGGQVIGGDSVVAEGAEGTPGKTDRLFDYYSDKLATGPYVKDQEGNHNPVVNSFVQYSVPPPPPPHYSQQPIMANVYWRKIIYPVMPMPQGGAGQTAAQGSSPAASTLDQTGKVTSTGGKSPKYLVYYVKKNGNTSENGMSLSSPANNDQQQQQLAQSIIRQIELMESSKSEADEQQPQQIIVHKTPHRDQDVGNSQMRFKVLKGKPPIGTQLIEVSAPAKRRPAHKLKADSDMRQHQNVFAHPFYQGSSEQDIILQPQGQRKLIRRGRGRRGQKRRKPINPYSETAKGPMRVVLAESLRPHKKRHVIRVVRI